jgi:hypothetical protein
MYIYVYICIYMYIYKYVGGLSDLPVEEQEIRTTEKVDVKEVEKLWKGGISLPTNRL